MAFIKGPKPRGSEHGISEHGISEHGIPEHEHEHEHDHDHDPDPDPSEYHQGEPKTLAMPIHPIKASRWSKVQTRPRAANTPEENTYVSRHDRETQEIPALESMREIIEKRMR